MKYGSSYCHFTKRDIQTTNLGSRCSELVTLPHPAVFPNMRKFCTVLTREFDAGSYAVSSAGEHKAVFSAAELVDFTKIAIERLPTVIIVGRPNVGKSALFNRLIRRREALVYNTPADHVTRDIRDGVAKLGDLRFMVLDSAGLEAEASSGSVLQRTAQMTGNVLARSQFALFLIDAR
ncbi:unnamed protein product [Cuscuta europaea]|nr:unnamed protein product [Cuscuta europaea]